MENFLYDDTLLPGIKYNISLSKLTAKSQQDGSESKVTCYQMRLA